MSAANPARWRWVEAGMAFAIHDFQIAEHGGSDGVRDGGAIESALMRPVNLALYAEPDAATWPHPMPTAWPGTTASSMGTNAPHG